LTTFRLMDKNRSASVQHTNTNILLHIDSTFKTNKSGYPVFVVGYSDLGGTFHVLCIAITSQRREPDVAWVLQMFQDAFTRLFEYAWNPAIVMGDADDAQFNGIEVSLQVFPAIQYLMCFFHVMQKCWEHGRQMEWSEWDAVTEDIYFLHMSSSRDMLDVRMRNVHIKWGQGSVTMQRFRNYFYRQWLPPLLNNDQVAIGSRFWKWQIFHSAQGTALTNNP
ncbi:hypothetical protein AaE_006987, partial [Aphanomyces astaci]